MTSLREHSLSCHKADILQQTASLPVKFLRFFVVAALLTLASPTWAIDPLYQRQMERLAEIIGSLYFLQPLCTTEPTDWRAQMNDLINLDQPDEDRRQRLAGAFNGGYTAFARFHRACTPAAKEALVRLLTEAEKTAREIHTRFAE
jgi:uncharacterized protein (TIGR02301 family)